MIEGSHALECASGRDGRQLEVLGFRHQGQWRTIGNTLVLGGSLVGAGLALMNLWYPHDV